MGYKPPKQHYNLIFEDRPGLVVTAKSVPLGKMNYLSTLKINHAEEDTEKREELFRTMAQYIVKWNIVHPEPEEVSDGQDICLVCGLKEDDPMPVRIESMRCLDIELLAAILTGWMFAIARASVPKGMNLNDGAMTGQSPPLPDGMTEEIIQQLETLQNPMTLPTPNFS